MKTKRILFFVIATIGLIASTTAQVPNYVPPNGLVGWWPLNANANDVGPNSIHGTISGASFSDDRFSNPNAASSFYANNDFIEIPTISGQFNNQQYSISYWFKTNQSASSTIGGPNVNPALISRLNVGGPTVNYPTSVDNFVIYEIGGSNHFNTPVNGGATGINTTLGNTWHHIVFTVRSDSSITYLNGVKVAANVNGGNITFQPYPIRLGRSQHTYWKDFSGELDDLGYWNRALTIQEVQDLFNATICSNDLVIDPEHSAVQTGDTVSFFASTSDPNPSFIWQSDFGQGFQTLNDFGKYSGANTNTLTISDLQLANHLQELRAISNSSSCTDTSDIAIISLTDTCINSITVTDTLIINATLSALTSPNNLNTIKIYPNPASTHITVDFGNYGLMNDHTLRITNMLGQSIYSTLINQQTSYIDLSTWTGNGLYSIEILTPQGNVIQNRKIILQ